MTGQKLRIGVLGGTFDPPHYGHLLLAESACDAAGLDRVLFMPTHIQPFKQGQEVSPNDERLQMLRLALNGNPRFHITTVETDRKGVSYTIDSLRELRDSAVAREILAEGEKLAFIVGTDMFLMIEKWYRADELLREFDIIVGIRSGGGAGVRQDEAVALAEKIRREYGTRVDLIDNPPFGISSTMVRDRLASGESLRYIVPDDVRHYLAVRAAEKKSRWAHTKLVIGLASELAARNDESAHKAAVAALFHDLCKDGSKPENALAHAGEAADLMRSEYGIEDEDILNAVRYHTTGRAGMSKLEMIVFLADTLEPSRRYEGVARLRGKVYEDLHEGALMVLKSLNEFIIKEDKEPARDSLEAIEWLAGIVDSAE
ncbi:MAG: nicotinate-nucleotide adenylyltransferase [Clostridiales Family XIII bacterium]|jgi:nicotinate-nucleotide adenylyltransferase|nr:nicotinate-nucleotide adenylyltransferase [Clostridiales Family XIII bacterium]